MSIFKVDIYEKKKKKKNFEPLPKRLYGLSLMPWYNKGTLRLNALCVVYFNQLQTASNACRVKIWTILNYTLSLNCGCWGLCTVKWDRQKYIFFGHVQLVRFVVVKILVKFSQMEYAPQKNWIEHQNDQWRLLTVPTIHAC